MGHIPAQLTDDVGGNVSAQLIDDDDEHNADGCSDCTSGFTMRTDACLGEEKASGSYV